LEYFDLVRERMETRDREMAALRRASEARRLGLAPRGPIAAIDHIIIRAGESASARQARREYHGERTLAS
jgi:hypothetical protein